MLSHRTSRQGENLQKLRGGGKRGGRQRGSKQTKGGEAQEKNGYAGSSCSGRAAPPQAACHSGTVLPFLDMSLAVKVSCSMLNCFVSVSFVSDGCVLGPSSLYLIRLCVSASLPGSGGWGCCSTHERCSY